MREGEGSVVDLMHPLLGMYRAPVVACYGGHFPQAEVLALVATSLDRVAWVPPPLLTALTEAGVPPMETEVFFQVRLAMMIDTMLLL